MQLAGLAEKILQFDNGEDALRFLRENANEPDALPEVIFLDINMPIVDGWMFLEDYALMKDLLKKTIIIYMVSSSIDPRDLRRAHGNENVMDYILKPVSREKLAEIMQKLAEFATSQR
jgi:CheY-like chemotaxis protein